MPQNKRIFYATQGVKLSPVNEAGTVASEMIPGGLQSVGINTNFNLEKIFQLGQLELYDSIENNPEVEITLNKVFDGTKPLFLITMGGSNNVTSGNLIQFQNNRVNMDLFIHKDTSQGTSSASGVSKVRCTGLYASNFSYTFPTDGNATEEVTLLGTNKTWTENGPNTGAAVFQTDVSSKGTARRWKFLKSACVFPEGPGGMPSGSPLTNVTVSFDLGREAVYTLGQYEPYMRNVNFPVEISTEITSLAMDGDMISVNDVLYSCTGTSAVTNKEIKLVICGSGTDDKLVIDLGKKNKLQSVNYSGGDTGGGNVEISYSFTTDNSFTMISSGTFQQPAVAVVNPLGVSEPTPYTFGDN